MRKKIAEKKNVLTAKRSRFIIYIILAFLIFSYSAFNVILSTQRPYRIYKVFSDYYVEQNDYKIGVYNTNNVLHSNENIKAVITANNVKDIKAAFVADPFLVKNNDEYYIFFEVYNLKTKKGDLAVAKSSDGQSWEYVSVVLSEPFHLSYPQVFQYQDEYYMIPETWQANGIRLYKAVDFPRKWQYIKTLVEGKFVDASVIHHEGKWWLFATDKTFGKNDNLSIFHADELMGKWSPHKKNPVISGNPHHARCAGRIIRVDDTIIRFAQDDEPEYGKQIYAFNITKLSSEEFEEHLLGEGPLFPPATQGWNSGGMHHISPLNVGDNRWLVAVDGWKKRVRTPTNAFIGLMTFPLLY